MSDDVKFGITAEEQGLTASLSRAEKAVQGAVSKMEKEFKSLTSTFSRLQGLFAGITATLAGGALFGGAVKAAVDLTVESESLGRQLGISATQASILKVALDDVHASQEQVSSATSRIAQLLNSDEDAFSRLGIATRDANGNFRNSFDILQDVIRRLNEFGEGTDRNVAAAQIFGRSWREIEPILRLTAAALEDARVKGEALGLVVGEETSEKVRRLRAAMNDLEDVTTGVQLAIAEGLMPSLQGFGEWMGQNGPEVVRGMRLALAGWQVDIIKIASTIEDMFVQIEAVGRKIAVTFFGLGRLIKAAFTLDARGLADAWTTMSSYLDAIDAKAKVKLDGIRQAAEDTIEQIWRNADQPPFTPKNPPAAGAAGGSPSTGAGSANQLAALRAGLEEQKLAFQEAARAEGSFREFSKAQEADYWRDILETTRLSAADRLAVRRQLAQLELAVDKERFDGEIADLQAQKAEFKKDAESRLEIAREVARRMGEAYGEDSAQYAAARKEVVGIEREIAAELQAIYADEAASRADATLSALDEASEDARLRTALNQQTSEELLRQEMDFESRRADITRQALEEQIAIAEQAPDRDPAELARLHAEIEAQEREHQQRINAIRRQLVLEQNRHWLSAMRQMEGGFEHSISQMMKGQKTFADGMRAMAASVVDAIAGMITQMAAQWLVQQLAQMLGVKTSATAKIAAYSAEAGAAGVASWAGAPWPINMGAPAFGAAMSMAAKSFLPSVAAAGGYDVPSGLMPVAQLHPREMVLPAELADAVRDMTGSGGGGGRTIINLTVMDRTGVERVLRRSGRSLVKVAGEQARRSFVRPR